MKTVVSRDGAAAKKSEEKSGPDLSSKDIHPDGHGAAMDEKKPESTPLKRKDVALNADEQKLADALREKAKSCPLAESRLSEFMAAQGEMPMREFSAIAAEAEALIEQALEDAADSKHEGQMADAEAPAEAA